MSNNDSSPTTDPGLLALDFALRDTFLNAILVEAFMAGLYTLLFGYTASLLLNQTKYMRSYLPIFGATAVLYVFTMLHFTFQWLLTRQTWIVHGQTSEDTIAYLQLQPLWLHETSSVVNTSSTLIADGILVWRCWVIWGRSWAIIIVPALAWIAEFVSSIFALIFLAKPLSAQAITADPSAIYLGLSLATTVICTGLIAYRIISTMGPLGRSSPYMKVIQIIAESAALYSLALIIFLPMYCSPIIAVNFPSEYMKRIVGGITGMAPTLIVARVILAGPSTQSNTTTSRGTTATLGPIGIHATSMTTRDEDLEMSTKRASRSSREERASFTLHEGKE